MEIALIFIFGFFLAYANGANDNFKGVATLFGSESTDYKKALWWATLTTAAGSLVAVVFSVELLKAFSGKGLVEESILGIPSFPIAVGIGAAVTVMLATRLGFPISTTHSIVGALFGAGMLAASGSVNFSRLGSVFFLPLLVSPIIALLLSAFLYPVLRYFRQVFGISKESCVCVGTKEAVTAAPSYASSSLVVTEQAAVAVPTIHVGVQEECVSYYEGSLLGLNAQKVFDTCHYASAGMLSFARGLNDTPKIAAIMLTLGAFKPWVAFGAVLIGIAVGGLLNAKKVAETLSDRITEMNPGQGFTANIVAAFLVIFASKIGVPVSTTHVSCGALFGIGAVTKQGALALNC